MLQFAYPLILVVFPVLLLLALLFRKRVGRKSTIVFSSLQPLKGARQGFRVRLARVVPPLLRWLALACGLLVLARPQQIERKQWYESTGVEIMLTIDTSGSMKLLDMDTRSGQIIGVRDVQQGGGFFGPSRSVRVGTARPDTWNRLAVVKQVVKKFVEKRRGDQLSLAIFGTEARTLCPLTNDLNAVNELLKQVDIGIVGQATDIEKAIRFSLRRLLGLTIEDVLDMAKTRSEEYILEQIKAKKASFIWDKDAQKRIKAAKLSEKVIRAMKAKKPRSQLMILLTDGQHTAKQGEEGREDVLKAAQEAALYGIKIYTIGIGSKDYAFAPIKKQGRFNVVRTPTASYDEALMKEIARITKGRFFTAQDKTALQNVYTAINKMEPNKFKVHKWDDIKELYLWFLLPMLLLLLIEQVSRETIFKHTP